MVCCLSERGISGIPGKEPTHTHTQAHTHTHTYNKIQFIPYSISISSYYSSTGPFQMNHNSFLSPSLAAVRTKKGHGLCSMGRSAVQ